MFPLRLIGLTLWLFWPLAAGSWTNVLIGGWWPAVAVPAELAWLALLVTTSERYRRTRIRLRRKALGLDVQQP
jgi:hypothetical protein